MSQSGIFNLVVRDERFDKYFTASDFLKKRIAAIIKQRSCKNAQLPAGEKINVQPTFADLEKTHLLYLRPYYRPYVAVASEYVKVKASGSTGKISTAGGGIVDFVFPSYGHFTSDMVFHVRLSAVGTQSPTAASPYYRYCAYPGIRMFAKTEFTSDQLMVDDYFSDEVNLVNKFEIPQDRRAAWDRGLGQAAIEKGEFDNPNGHTGVYHFRDGLQTPKQYHPATDLWIPAHFFMCKDASQALLNDLVANTQRKVSVTLEKLTKLLYQYSVSEGGTTESYTAAALALSDIDVTIDLYVNNLFVNPEINDIFASRVDFSLIRVHRRQSKSLTAATDRILLDQMKYPIEYMYAGFRKTAQASDPDQWHLYGKPRTFTDDTRIVAATTRWNSGLGMNQLVMRTVRPTSTLDPLVSNITMTAHGIKLFPDNMPRSFFSDYLPQRYFPETRLVTAEDRSAMLITFCLYPGQYNPSGYYNLSVAREMYINYTAAETDVTPANPAQFYAAGSALNFIVRKGDSVTLRYAL